MTRRMVRSLTRIESRVGVTGVAQSVGQLRLTYFFSITNDKRASRYRAPLDSCSWRGTMHSRNLIEGAESTWWQSAQTGFGRQASHTSAAANRVITSGKIGLKSPLVKHR